MRTLVVTALALAAVVGGTGDGFAGMFSHGDRPTTIWVKIEAQPGEGLWQACRRLYQRDVYQVRGDRQGRPGIIWCNIDHSRLYDYGRRHQNFNN